MASCSSVFFDTVIRDPLFSAEGMDIANASRALDEIERSLEILEKLYAGQSYPRRLFFVRYPLARYAFPVPMLRLFLSAEEARRDFIESPCDDTSQRLQALWRSAAKSYSVCAARYRKLHRILVSLESSENAFVTQDMFGWISSFKDIDQTLVKLIENGRRLEGDADLLSRTRNNLIGSEGVTKTRARLERGTLNEWQRSVHEAEILEGVSPFRYVKIVERHGPFLYDLENFDGSTTGHPFMVYFTRDLHTKLKGVWVSLVDRYYLLDPWLPIKRDPNITMGTYATSIGLGPNEIPYWYEPATHLYNSRDLAYWPILTSLVDLERRPFLAREPVMMQYSSAFDAILSECARDLRAMQAHLQRRSRAGLADSFSPLYDLVTRSIPSIMYLTFNRSVWRLSARPAFLTSMHVGVDSRSYIPQTKVPQILRGDMLRTVMRVQRLREERGRAAGWLA